MTPIDRTDPTVRPSDAGHGPECPMGSGAHPWYWDAHHREWRRRGGDPVPSCLCVACHCGPDSDPSGWLGSCARCYRPIVRDGRVVRAERLAVAFVIPIDHDTPLSARTTRSPRSDGVSR